MPRYHLPVCRWRRSVPWPGRQGCDSPICGQGVHGVPDHVCWMCPDADHVDPRAPAAAAPGAGAIRHLLYHLYPIGEWRSHTGMIRRHASLWQGRRIVAVAVGPGTASADEVRAELDGLGVELLVVANNPQLKEMASYPLLLEQLQGHRSALDVHMYAHSKGVVSQQSMGPAARRWAEAMWEALCDHWPACRRALRSHAAVGIFRRGWRGPVPTRAAWHYSGSFRWVRNADLYGRSWQTIDRTWLGSETHPGLVFGPRETACLYGEFATQDIGLYADSEWERWAEPRRQEWLSAHADDRQQPLLVTVILTAAHQRELVHEAIDSVRRQTTDSWELVVMDAGPMADAGVYDRYREDARIRVHRTGETSDLRRQVGIQSWAINECWRRGLVRGDLVTHLCDDDVYHPGWLSSVIDRARTRPHETAWYGTALRERIMADGARQVLPALRPVGPGSPSNPLRCRADGMQVAHRAAARTDWPEGLHLAEHADGWWIDALAANHTVCPIDALAGTHRHTPGSTYTR